MLSMNSIETTENGGNVMVYFLLTCRTAQECSSGFSHPCARRPAAIRTRPQAPTWGSGQNLYIHIRYLLHLCGVTFDMTLYKWCIASNVYLAIC